MESNSLLRAFGFNCLRLGTSIHWFQSCSGRSGDRPRHPLSLCGLSVASPSSRQSSFLKMRLLLLGWFAPVSTSIPLQGNVMSQKNWAHRQEQWSRAQLDQPWCCLPAHTDRGKGRIFLSKFSRADAYKRSWRLSDCWLRGLCLPSFHWCVYAPKHFFDIVPSP